jgi:2,4'-dihydroxyacetophenone dioxygenase
VTGLTNPTNEASTHVPDHQDRSIDVRKIACQLPQPAGMIPESFVAAALDVDADGRGGSRKLRDAAFRPLMLIVSPGHCINILRVHDSGVLSRHRHGDPVHTLTLCGQWRNFERRWAAPRDYAFELAGKTHPLVVPDEVHGMATLFGITALHNLSYGCAHQGAGS